MKRLTFNVSFRLDERVGKMLKERAETGGTTANDVARKIVEEKLNRNDDAMLDGLNFLGQMVSELNQAMNTRLDQVAEKQTTQADELATLKASINRDLQKLIEQLNEN